MDFGAIISGIVDFFSNAFSGIVSWFQQTFMPQSKPAETASTTPTATTTTTSNNVDQSQTSSPPPDYARLAGAPGSMQPGSMQLPASTGSAQQSDQLTPFVKKMMGDAGRQAGLSDDEMAGIIDKATPIVVATVKINPNSNADDLSQKITDALMADQAMHQQINDTVKAKAGGMAFMISDSMIHDQLSGGIKNTLSSGDTMAQLQAAMAPAPSQRLPSIEASSNALLGRPQTPGQPTVTLSQLLASR